MSKEGGGCREGSQAKLESLGVGEPSFKDVGQEERNLTLGISR